MNVVQHTKRILPANSKPRNLISLFTTSRICILIILILSKTTDAQVFDITGYGAVGNGTTLNTTAIQNAVDACYNAGGGIVNVPSGVFLTATIFLKSNVELHLEQGATIKGSSVVSDYPDVIPLVRSYADNYPQRSVFYAEGQHNISITGDGKFDGNGTSVSFLLDASHKPYGFRFISCSNIKYMSVTLINSGL